MSKRFYWIRLVSRLVVAFALCAIATIGIRWYRHQEEAPRGNQEPVAAGDISPSAQNATTTTALPALTASANAVESKTLMDPAADGWTSELVAERAKKRLGEILDEIAKGKAGTLDGLMAGTRVPRLRQSMQTAYRDETVRVERAQLVDAQETLPLDLAIRELVSPLIERGSPTFLLKVVGVDVISSTPSATYLYEAHAGGNFQQTAKLRCTWSDVSDHASLLSIAVDELEEVERLKAQAWFVDCTESVLESEPSYAEQLKYGMNYWMQRIERAHGMDDSVRTGLAIGDANGDGREDIYLCQGPGLPNKLLLQQPDGTVIDASESAGVNWLDHTSSALFIDLDNDGDQDLVVGASGGLVVMENDGTAKFHREVTLTPQLTDVQSLTAADYDSDGDLDLFVCVYRHDSGRAQEEFVFHDASGGGRNYLFRNDLGSTNHWKFTDVTNQVGLQEGATRYTLAASWEDYDNDGDPDLYLANDYGRNYLFENADGLFRDVTEAAGLIDTGFGMSVDWGDYNRDGQMDLYVGNMFSSAGSRVTQQPAFQAHASPEQRVIYQRMAQGNSLFAGTRDGRFQDVSRDAQVQMGRWAWSSVFADLNNDSWEDLVVANGYITADDTGDL